jgi:hypothetical protein
LGANLPQSLDLEPGYILTDQYQVIRRLGKGWEGEVYAIKELSTGIERAAKIFYAARNRKNKTATIYAKKLHKLRHCSVLILYINQVTFRYNDLIYTLLVSEFVEGITLTEFLKKSPRKRLAPFGALHLLYALVKGVEEIHSYEDYLGDLHAEYLIIQRYGIVFEFKVIDMFHRGRMTRENQVDDLVDCIHIFYEALGGKKHYASQPKHVKYICSGLKRGLIQQKFRNMSGLRVHLESLSLEPA